MIKIFKFIAILYIINSLNVFLYSSADPDLSIMPNIVFIGRTDFINQTGEVDLEKFKQNNLYDAIYTKLDQIYKTSPKNNQKEFAANYLYIMQLINSKIKYYLELYLTSRDYDLEDLPWFCPTRPLWPIENQFIRNAAPQIHVYIENTEKVAEVQKFLNQFVITKPLEIKDRQNNLFSNFDIIKIKALWARCDKAYINPNTFMLLNQYLRICFKYAALILSNQNSTEKQPILEALIKENHGIILELNNPNPFRTDIYNLQEELRKEEASNTRENAALPKILNNFTNLKKYLENTEITSEGNLKQKEEIPASSESTEEERDGSAESYEDDEEESSSEEEIFLINDLSILDAELTSLNYRFNQIK